MRPPARSDSLARWVAIGWIGWLGIAAAHAEEARPLQLEVLINGAPTNLIGAFSLDDAGRIGAERQELKTLGLRVDGDGPATEAIALDRLSNLTYDYDVRAQRLLVTAADDRLLPKVFELRPQVTDAVGARADYGAVLNYNLFGASSAKGGGLRGAYFEGASASLDLRGFTPYGTLGQTAIVRTSPIGDATALRLDTSFTYSDPERMVTYRAGDTITNGFVWTRPIRMAGLQVARRFSLRPDLVTMPLPSYSGSAAVPSIVDVYVNNLKTFSSDVGTGPYSLTNIPAVTGAGNARVVLRDAAGHETQTTLPFYASPQLLRPGLTDFSLEAGVARRYYATPADYYLEKAIGSASLRRGITDWLTLESHAEAGMGLWNGGIGAILRTGSFGVASAALASSYYQSAQGWQAYAGYTMRAFGLTIDVSSQRTFGAYNDLAAVTATSQISPTGFAASSFSPISYLISSSAYLSGLNYGTSSVSLFDARPPKALDRISIGTMIPGWTSSINVAFTNLEYLSGSRSRILSASWSTNISDGIALTATAFTDLSASRSSGIFVGLSMPLGGGAVASATQTNGAGGSRTAVDAIKPLGLEPGSVGWRVRAGRGELEERSGAVSYRSSYGWAEAAVRNNAAGTQATGQVDGSIVAMAGGVFAANRIDNSFAVVDTGTADVDVYSENRLVGKTDERGRLLVTGLRSYEKNKIAIDTRSLPVDSDIETTAEFAIPADRAGVKVAFPVKSRADAALVTLVMPDGKTLPSGAAGELSGGEAFFVGYDGQAFIRGLTHQNEITVSTAAGTCRASFPFDPKPGEQVVLGPVTCNP